MAATENPQKTTRRGGFRKGVSGNPGGRPKGLAAMIRALTNDGQDIVTLLVKVMNDKKENMRFRLDAAKELSDRGFGKPIQGVEVTGEDGKPVEVNHKVRLRTGDLDALIDVRQRHRALLEKDSGNAGQAK